MPFDWVPCPYSYDRYFPVPSPCRRHGVRSDVEIMGDLTDVLATDPRVDTGEIALEVSGGIVTLMGTVPVFEQRHLAVDGVRRHPPVPDAVTFRFSVTDLVTESSHAHTVR